MRWRQRREQRRLRKLAGLEIRLCLHREMLLEQHRALLLEALQPVAEAMRRLDQRILANQMQGVEHQQELRELLLEVLSSLQPSALTQLSPLIGLPAPMTTSPSSAS